MYISDLIRDTVNKKLQETFIGKMVGIQDYDTGKDVTFYCTNVEWDDDDGNVFIIFTDESHQTYTADGQGIDIWYYIYETD